MVADLELSESNKGGSIEYPDAKMWSRSKLQKEKKRCIYRCLIFVSPLASRRPRSKTVNKTLRRHPELYELAVTFKDFCILQSSNVLALIKFWSGRWSHRFKPFLEWRISETGYNKLKGWIKHYQSNLLCSISFRPIAWPSLSGKGIWHLLCGWKELC